MTSYLLLLHLTFVAHTCKHQRYGENHLIGCQDPLEKQSKQIMV